MFHNEKVFLEEISGAVGDNVSEAFKHLVVYRASKAPIFPRPISTYLGEDKLGVLGIVTNRFKVEPFNLIATLIFLFAIIHTFLTTRFLAIAHHLAHDYDESVKAGNPKEAKRFGSEVLHFVGEVEAVFGIWAIALGIVILLFYGPSLMVHYLSNVNYTEPMFVVVIMTLASTRPVIKLAELMMKAVANRLGGNLTAWWFTILVFGPLLGSFITEPAAMTISALLLAKRFYSLDPSPKFAYATIGLLFVNISVGGTLSHFAAPPVLMVATPWDWGFGFMFGNFGWKAALGIVIASGVYYVFNKTEMLEMEKRFHALETKRRLQITEIDRKGLEKEFAKMDLVVNEELGFNASFEKKCAEIKAKFKSQIADKFKQSPDLEAAFEYIFDEVKFNETQKTLPGLLPAKKRAPYRDPNWDTRPDHVPFWVMGVHVFFMAWTVLNAHHPPLFIAGFLFYLGFAQTTNPFQNRTDLKPALLVGFFLAGLVIHGGVQAWWIAPVLGSLGEVPLMFGATILTAFNDNAAITYLSTLIPNLGDEFKYAVVAGAVTGGGLTVIANAPNPAGQSILARFFENGVSPAGLVKAAFIPTIIMGLCFMLLRF
ncbi:MAG: putative Na+/H+ antiporter [SAR324 cluster bacterium]|nr:putative Na+/H+ antiporter [SAR324 cluster bacterium]